MAQKDDLYYKREKNERKPWREFLAIASSDERLPPRICCKVCATVLAVLAISVLSFVFYLFTQSHRHSQPEARHDCDLRCALHAVKWVNLTSIDTGNMKVEEQTAVLALDTLSRSYAKTYGEAFMVKHIRSKMRQQQADAQRVEKQITELTNGMTRLKSLPAPELMKDHSQELRDVTAQISSAGRVIDLLQSGMSWDEAQGAVDAAAHADSNKACGQTLRQLAIECEEPGIIPSFFRAVKPSPHIALTATAAPTWPLLPSYPGLRTLNDESSIHIIDGFLTDDEIDALLKDASRAELERPAEPMEPILRRDDDLHALAASVLVETESNVSHNLAGPPKTKKRRMKVGGSLMELDVYTEGLHNLSKRCQQFGSVEESMDPQEVFQTFASSFEEDGQGQDLQTCLENKAFAKSDLHTLVCPTPSASLNQVTGKITHLLQGRTRHLEPMKVLHYREGEADADHWDSMGLDGEAHSARLATIMVYLTDVQSGGGTYFPNLDLRVDPQRGRALIFPPLSMDLQVMSGTLHAEEEVKKGNKWVLTTHLVLGADKVNADPCAA